MYKRNYIKQILEQFAVDKQNRIALKLYNGKQITDIRYPDLAEKILSAAGFFRDKGLEGRHIALLGTNSLEWLVAFFAITASGNIAVPLNPALPKETVCLQCLQTDVSVICGDKCDVSEFTEDFLCVTYDVLCSEKPLELSEIADTEPDALTVLLFTSGTTGQSRAVELTYANMESSLKSADGVFAEPEIDRIMTALPMFHIAGIRGALSMLFRYKMLCIGRGIAYLFRDMPVLMPDYIPLVPMIVESLIKIMKRTTPEELQRNYLGKNLKRICIGGATVDPDSCRFLMENGFTVDSGYALSETTGVGTWGRWDEAHFNTIGKLSEELQCRITDGELLLKGPAVMKGYYKDPEATKMAIEDGWLHTGDLVSCDADGYYYLTGRKKNLIVMPNGEKLNPEEIEKQFESCSGIEECMIWYQDQRSMLCMEIYTNNKTAAQNVIETYNERMPLSYQIRKVVYRDGPFEKTGSGKRIRKERM